jgi:hypothetical protein
MADPATAVGGHHDAGFWEFLGSARVRRCRVVSLVGSQALKGAIVSTPSLTGLRAGALLGSIVHATVQPRFAMFFEGWFGDLYYLNDWQGTNGAVMFFVGGAVGAFYDVHSRHKWEWLLQNQDSFFRGMPADLRAIADKITVQYLQQEVAGRARPVVTAVFWSAGDVLTAAVPWPEFMENGGHVLRVHLMEPEMALAEWAVGYELSTAEVDFARTVFERKSQAKTSWTDLSEGEARWLAEQAESVEGMRRCRQAFAEIGIYVPCIEEEARLSVRRC